MDLILSGIILTTFFILGVSRLSACIRAVALQGALLSVLPVLERGAFLDPHGLILFGGTFLIKSLIIPALLFRSIREANLQKEMGPVAGAALAASRHLSLLVGGVLMVIAFSWGLPGPASSTSSLIVPVALSTVLMGFLLLVTRTKAVTQVIGFLVLDNGIFLFGMTLFSDFPLTVEMGVLLDLLVGVFVMGIMIHQIHRTFDHIDTARLATSEGPE